MLMATVMHDQAKYQHGHTGNSEEDLQPQR